MKHMLLAMSVAMGLAQAQPVKVGVINKAGLVISFYGSPQWSAGIKGKMAELQAARQAGDKTKQAELEKWGEGQQEKAHQQLSGEAPLDNILEALKPAWPEIARRAGVSVLVVDLPYAGDGVEQVDATPQLMDYLNADARVRKWVEEARKMKGPIRVH
jgi:hypothetical protein